MLTSVALMTVLGLSAGTAVSDAAPAPVTHTVVIGLDGTMLDFVKSAQTPNLHRLLAAGTSGQSSIAGHPTISGPSWSTVLTGVWQDKHGATDNTFFGAQFSAYPTVFTRIERATPAARTASIATWSGIASIAGAGSPHADLVRTTPDAGTPAATDTATATAVATEVRSNGPALMFAHLDQVDAAGHASGTNGSAYKAAIEKADAAVGTIVSAVDARASSTGERWTVLVNSDHGHKPTGGHGGQSAAETATFVIARGASYAPGAVNNTYSIVSITPTILANLGMAQPSGLDGSPLKATR